MSATRGKLSLPLVAFAATAVALLASLALLASASGAYAAAPIKEVPFGQFGWEVDKTTNANVCTVESGDKCQSGKESANPGGFAFPNGVAVAPNGDLYVADTINHRVQELTAAGAFVRMFGWEVDKTTKTNVCTEASGDTCGAGVEGGLAGQMAFVYGIAVDQATGNVFVQDFNNWRIDEYTPGGEFVLMFGGEVDKTTKANVCTEASGDTCGPGVASIRQGAFAFIPAGDLLAAGGPGDLLYVGDEHRVQEFDPATGERKGEISLASISVEPNSEVVDLALDNSCALHEPAPLTETTSPTCKAFDPEYGDLYLVYKVEHETNVIRKFDPRGEEVKEGHFPLTLSPTNAKTGLGIRGLALDGAGRLAVAEEERLPEGFRLFGALYDGRTGRFITEFATVNPVNGVTFGREGGLYAASGVYLMLGEVNAYKPVPVAELLTSPVPCKAGGEKETDITFNCELNGEVDPWGVKETEVWFEWGKTPVLGQVTPRQPVGANGSEGKEEPLVKVSAPVKGLRPDTTYRYRLAGYDKNVKPPEGHLSSETASLVTPLVAPKVVGPPHFSFVTPTSAVLSGELNPENARTEYFFEYAEESLEKVCPEGVKGRKACAGVAATPVLESSRYGKTGVTQEAVGLHPGTYYHFRLFAQSEDAEKATKMPAIGKIEGEFATAPAAQVEAVTGGDSAITTTSAIVSGAVNPSGQAATYAFELGVYAGAATQYVVVFSGSAGAGTTFVTETLPLTGLQPGTEYAYRIKAENAYGKAWGQAATFKTEGLPIVLPLVPAPVMLPVPPISFPRDLRPSTHPCKPGYKRDRHGKCVRGKRAKRSRKRGRGEKK